VIVRKLKALNSPVIVSANHQNGAKGGATANSPSIDSTMTAAANATAQTRPRPSRSDIQPSTGSWTMSKRRSTNSSMPSAARLTPNVSA
jgi:hypothetical protein